jgi:molybdopterin-guanine dinucleotide biosynthesis protein A
VTLFGIFVGGRATRMQGQAKGLLTAPDTGEALAVRLARIGVELGCTPVLVGADARYRALLPAITVLEDRVVDIGPLAGLSSLLEAAADGDALAVACDLPYVSRTLLARLLREQPGADVLAPRASNGVWEPLTARYRSATVRPVLEQALARGVRSFQQLFRELDVHELTLDSAEQRELCDWDRPEDVET